MTEYYDFIDDQYLLMDGTERKKLIRKYHPLT